MTVPALALLIATSWTTVALPTAVQSPGTGGCTDWRDCRQQALAAAERGEYEIFHDLAWRAVQTGPPKDSSLMYLLARAQSLSGRPHDALVMLQRLADMGVATDAAVNADFSRTRELREWPEVLARMEGTAPPAASPAAPSPAVVTAAASVSPSPSPAAKPAPGLSVIRLAPATEAVRFSATPFVVSGLAYDAISRRFVLGDRVARKLIVVDEVSNHTVDLVRADSAGFLEISAVEIDAKRGDLWVASAAAAGGAGTLHRLQLISGRPLKAFHVGADLGPVKLVDLAVGPAGAVLVLDSLTPQLLVLRSGGTALERIVRIDAQEPVSVAAGGDDGIAFVAHRDGISRIDLRSRTASRVAAPKGVSIGHLERIRRRGTSLIAVQVEDDGSRRITRLEMNAKGNAITQATRIEVSAPAAGQSFVTISGDELLYLRAGSSDAERRPSDPGEEEFVASRVSLR